MRFLILLFSCIFFYFRVTAQSYLRVNQLGYAPDAPKMAVWGSKKLQTIKAFYVVDAVSGKKVYRGKSGKPFGKYGPFLQTYRLDFSDFTKNGRYYIATGDIRSPEFTIGEHVYDGLAGFSLRYMRQQRSGFNPFLKDSCHTADGVTVYAPVADGTPIDVWGGWHDATDYLQYATTSANATWHLLAAARDFPAVFSDDKGSNGLDGKNGIPDVLDEAKWGLDWLLKMYPRPNWLFNQLGDDRDHKGFRLPQEEQDFYGYGRARPVYFCTGKPQGLFKYKNNSTGIASTAGKFSSAFALGSHLLSDIFPEYARNLAQKSATVFQLGTEHPGVCQTAPGTAPYYYAEDNWTDDMELAAAERGDTTLGFAYALKERVTPWLGKDTANHYQWYPFINPGHYELAKRMKGIYRDSLVQFYREGIDRVWQKAGKNAFYRGIPFIWCSNNLTTAFAIQCYWYRMLSGDKKYLPLEQACFDWLLGANPWGTAMIVNLPRVADAPSDPHSSLWVKKKYPIDGGLVDGPVYTSIFKGLIGIHLAEADEYADLQSDLAVYHDDYGDFSTNEPTMDGTAVLIYLLAAKQSESNK